MPRTLPRWMLFACFAALAVGTVLRPVLIVLCEIHAARFAQAGDPHAHEHAAGDDVLGGDSEGAHGDHEAQQFSSLATIDDGGGLGDVPRIRFGAPTLPRLDVGPLPDPHRVSPFRPPIG